MTLYKFNKVNKLNITKMCDDFLTSNNHSILSSISVSPPKYSSISDIIIVEEQCKSFCDKACQTDNIEHNYLCYQCLSGYDMQEITTDINETYVMIGKSLV